MNERAKTILNFWFKESAPEEHFKRNDNFDKKIRFWAKKVAKRN